MHCPGGNATDPIWRVLASSLGISCWTPLKPHHSNPTLTLWPINSGVLTSLLLPHLSSSLTDSLASLNLLCHSKTDARFMQDAPKAVWSIPYVSVAFFPSLKQNYIAYRSSKVSSRPDCIFKIHQLWQSRFSRVYSNSCCSWKLIECTTYILPTSSLGRNALFMVISFLVLWSICLSSSLVHFKNGPKYLNRGTAQVFIPLIRFQPYSFVSSSFLVLLEFSFLIFFLSSALVWWYQLPISPSICRFHFLGAF